MALAKPDANQELTFLHFFPPPSRHGRFHKKIQKRTKSEAKSGIGLN